MVGNRMKKGSIILLVALIMVGSVCACENLGAEAYGTSRENDGITSIYKAISRSVTSGEATAGDITSYSSAESRILESRYFNLISAVKYRNGAVRSWNLKFNQPAREVDMAQNNQPDFMRERSGQLPPAMSREEPVRRGIPDRDELNKFAEEQTPQWEDVTSNYQMYVTPDAEAVNSYLEENDLDDKYEIYEAALSWTWVSDKTLNDEEEQWLTPTEFLEETPAYSSSPVCGEPASDCEEQANTLTSLLIASGEYNESTVRVAIGKVDFGDVSGGHAWVEVYEDGGWFPLDPTDGPYYDDESSELIPADSSDIDYEEFLKSEYPAVEIWYYYNNEYFIDLETKIGNAPVSWNKKPESYQKT